MAVIANLELARRMVGAQAIVKAASDDDAARMRVQLQASDDVIRAKFEEMVAWIRAQNSVDDIERAIVHGFGYNAIGDIDAGARAFAAQINDRFAAAAADILRSVSSATGQLLHFDITNHAAIEAMQRNTLEVVQGLVEEQRDMIRAVISAGLETGTNPRIQAQAIRESIGLTDYDVQVVENYRSALLAGDAHALDYKLRDARFDQTVQRAVNGDRRLTADQIDRYVSAMRQNRIAFRAETIGRTEALRSLHEGTDAGLVQAITSGNVDRARIERTWYSAHDPRTRSSHRAMQNQKRPFGVAFQSGDGVALRYPGDPNAPADETANCQCVVATRILREPVQIATP